MTMQPQAEIVLRLGFFFGILLIMAILEVFLPRKELTTPKSKRWINNLGVTLVDSIIVRLLFPAAAIGVALYAQEKHIGLFNQHQLNPWIEFISAILILDLTIYLQHILFHAVPLFWRFHRMHHIDLDFDVTTGIRFHPFEIVLSLLIKFAIIILIGCPPQAVLIFEVILNGTSMFNHSNIKLPLTFDKWLRKIIVTPDMHRVHHSVLPKETNSNFGFNLSLWDRLFGTYIDQPQLGHKKMIIGISTIRDYKFCLNLLGMLWVPFIKENREYPINRQ